jgi:hypothetical protein
MIALALVGLRFMQRRRPVPGVLLLVASTAVKYVTGVVLALSLAAAVFEARGARARAARAAGLGGLVLVATALLFAPFWRGGAGLRATADLLVDRAVVQPSSPGPGLPLPALLGFATLVAVALVTAARFGWPVVATLSSGLSLVFAGLVFSWQLPWYMLPAIALALAGPRTRASRVVLGAAMLVGMGLMLLYGHIVPGRPL